MIRIHGRREFFSSKIDECFTRPQRKRGMNRWLHHRRQEQKLVYFELFKVSSARDKTRYIEESKQKAAQKTA